MWPDRPIDILPVVPARGTSVRLPRKNVALLGSMPLIGWSLAAAREAGFEDVLLSTEDPEIARTGSDLGFRVPFLRPSALSEPQMRNIDVLTHLVAWIEAKMGHAPRALLLLQPTSPFRGASLVREAVSAWNTRPETPGAIAVTDGAGDGRAAWRMSANGLLSTADSGEATCRSTGALYLIRVDAMRERLSTSPEGAIGIRHAGASTLDIDEAKDLAEARRLLASGEIDPPHPGAFARPGTI